MDKYTIGNNAGIVWTLLNDGKRWKYEDLKAASALSDRDLNAAIGWLACEGKIQFDESMQGQNTALYIELSYYIG